MTVSQILKWMEKNIDELDVERRDNKVVFVLWPSHTPKLESVEIKRSSIRGCVEAAVRMGCAPKSKTHPEIVHCKKVIRRLGFETRVKYMAAAIERLRGYLRSQGKRKERDDKRNKKENT